jgi:hypothetical protein
MPRGGGLNRPDGPINPPPQDTANPYISGNAALNGGYGGAVGPNAPYGAGGNNDGMMANNNNNNMLADHSGSHGRTWGAGAPNNGPLGSDRARHLLLFHPGATRCNSLTLAPPHPRTQ